MKRLLVLFTVLVPLSLFVAGCGGQGGKSEKAKAFIPETMAKGGMPAEMKAKMQSGPTKAPGAPAAPK